MEKCLHEFIEEQSLKTPESIALIHGERLLTYAELNGRANQLAGLLRNKGIGPEVVVAVYMERSVEMIVCILGILKAGAAYLPVDTAIPDDRAEFMIIDSEASIVITDQSSSNAVNRLKGSLEVIATDSIDWSAAEPKPRSVSKPEHLAYIIYTSGSTGTPKGVMIEHRSIANTIAWRKAYYNFDGSDCVIQFASISFDSSVEDIFSVLASGAKLVLLQQDSRNDLRYIRGVLASHQVTHFLVVPSLYKVLLDEFPEVMNSLKKVTVAGEGFSRSLVEKHYRILPHVELFNEYGPTENSVCTTIHNFSGPYDEVNIGLPIANVECYIVTPNMEPCPTETEGELLVSGAGLARGYLHHPGLTAEKFFRHPAYPGKRLYRTGDLVKVGADGDLVYLGRIDRQVKLRGYRIELGEIEYQLTQLQGVNDAAATLIHIQESPFLCAYYVSDGKTGDDFILSHLRRMLPDYMVPAFLVQLDRIPLTFNGKTDVGALPHPVPASAADERLAANSESQQIVNRLHQIIIELHDKSSVDNKQLIRSGALAGQGLDSLGFMRLLVRIETEFGLEIENAEWEILKTSTVEQIAEYISDCVIRTVGI